MDLFDLLIIYLACGAPFAVHYSFRAAEDRRSVVIGMSALVGIAWPLVGVAYAVAAVRRNSRTPRELERQKRIAESTLRSLESCVDLSGRPDLTFEFRDVVAAFTGLSLAAGDPTTAPAAAALSELSGHPALDLAAAIFARRERKALQKHLDAASTDLVELVSRFSGNADLLDSAVAAAEGFGDHGTAAALRELDLGNGSPHVSRAA